MSGNVQRYTDEGLRVLLAEDWLIFVANESDGRVYAYVTEFWTEWLDVPEGAPVDAMIPFAHDYRPTPIAKSNCDYWRATGANDHMTVAEWESEHALNV